MASEPKPKSKLGLILTWVFVVALVMGPGPGLVLANRPTTIFGIPALYFWGLLWYVVEVSVVVIAFFCVWPKEDLAADDELSN